MAAIQTRLEPIHRGDDSIRRGDLCLGEEKIVLGWIVQVWFANGSNRRFSEGHSYFEFISGQGIRLIYSGTTLPPAKLVRDDGHHFDPAIWLSRQAAFMSWLIWRQQVDWSRSRRGYDFMIREVRNGWFSCRMNIVQWSWIRCKPSHRAMHARNLPLWQPAAHQYGITPPPYPPGGRR